MNRTALETAIEKNVLKEKSLNLLKDVISLQDTLIDGLLSSDAPPPKDILILALREMYRLSTIAARGEDHITRMLLTVHFNVLVAYIESDGDLDARTFVERMTPALASINEKTRASVEKIFKEGT